MSLETSPGHSLRDVIKFESFCPSWWLVLSSRDQARAVRNGADGAVKERGCQGKKKIDFQPAHIKFYFLSCCSQASPMWHHRPKHFPGFTDLTRQHIQRQKRGENAQHLMLIENKKRTCPTDMFLCHCLRMLVAQVTQGEVNPCLLPTSPRTQTTNFLLCFFVLLSIYILMK